MKAYKQITKNGAICLPLNLRTETGFLPGTAVELNINPDGSLTIRKVVVCCHFCGSPEQVLEVSNIRICQKCAKKILAKVDITND